MYLKKSEIIAYRSMEITRDGTGKPTNRVHFHLLIDSDSSEKELRLILRDCCLCSGLTENEFRIDYKPVGDFLGLASYITKLNRPEKTILFAKYTGLRKFETIGPWYVDESGNPIRRKQAWKNIIEVQKAKAELEGSGSNVSEPQPFISTSFKSATNERNSQMTNTDMQHYDLNWIEYDFSTQKYYLKPDSDYQSLEVEDGQLFVSWSEVQMAIETLRDEAFDRPVKHIVVDDDNCKFLRSENNVTQAGFDEWIGQGKNVFDNADIRKLVPLPNHAKFDDVIFILFFEDGDVDAEEEIFTWAVFVPSKRTM